MRFFRKYKKEIASFLLVTLFYGVVLEQFSAYAKTLPQKMFYSNAYTHQDEIVPFVNQQTKEESLSKEDSRSLPVNSTVQKSFEVVETSVLYPADIAYGQIGRTDKIAFDFPEDNLFTITIKDEIDSKASYRLSYEVYGIANVSGVTKSINTTTSKGGFYIHQKQDWSRLTEYVLPKNLKKGKNTILFTSDVKTNTGYLVRNVQLEKVNNQQDDILLINDIVKDNDGKQVYVQGIIQNDLNDIQLYANNKAIQLFNNSFEFVVDVEDIDVKQLHIEVRKQNQKLAEKQFDIQKLNKTSFTKTVDYAFNRLEYKVTNGEEHRYALENMSVVIKDSSYAKDFTLSIQELRPSDYAPTGMSLHNVTKNQSAYRFLPDGIVFNKDVELRLKYDIKALPRGYNPKDIQVFYFDTTTRQWTKVKVIAILEDTQEVVALTNHFTDYIAGVIQEPESPETTAFAPTIISGIQAANPTENVAMVSVPQINDKGDASLSFPLMLPPARQGMVPDLSINYNSSTDDGDFGVGWDLAIPTIEIDTRWGTVLNDSNKETEAYLYNGEELLMVKADNSLYAPNKDPLINRVNADVKFQKMKHDPTLEIIRKYDQPYFWEVRNKTNGWLYTYEKKTATKWYLTKVEDVDGNYMLYEYTDNELDKIRYNLNSKIYGPASNTFPSREEIRIEIIRKYDRRNDEKFSLKTNTKSTRLIEKIIVSTQANEIEVRGFAHIEYSFFYKTGKFGRTLLTNIEQKSQNNYNIMASNRDAVIENYAFEYHDDIGTGPLFESTGKEVVTYKDYETEYDKFKVYISALGGSEGKSTSFGGGVSGGGVLPIFPSSYLPFSRSATIGGNLGGGSSNSETKVMMVDIDGDGLPDKLFKGGSDFYYRKNLGGKFSNDIFRIKNLPNLGYSKSNSNEQSFAINILAGSFNKSFSESNSTTYSYMTDVNADGLLDVVDNERVYFGYIDPQTKLPAFSLDSSITPSIVVKEEDVEPILNPLPSLELTNGLMDMVMVWRAPINGKVKVKVKGTISKEHIALQSGVKFSIEKLHESDMGKAQFLFGPYLLLSSNESHNNTVDVVKGDLLFFRVHSNQVPVQELGITWSPEIVYENQNIKSSLNYPQFSSSYKESFVVAASQELTLKENGKYRLEWPNFSLYTYDNISIRVSYFAKNTTSNSSVNTPLIGNNVVIYEQIGKLNGYNTFNSPNKTIDITNISSNPSTYHYIKVEVIADSEAEWKDIDNDFKPKLKSLDGKEDIYLVPNYTNYWNNFTTYPYSDFTGYSTNDIFELNHNFKLPNCTKDVCNERYIYMVLKNYGGSVGQLVNNSGVQTQYTKYRYKIDSNGNIISRQQLNYQTMQYDNISNNTTFRLGGWVGEKIYVEYYTTEDSIAEQLDNYQNSGSNFLVRVANQPPKSSYIDGANNYGAYKANIYSSENRTGWGTMHRNWGQFAYKGSEAGQTYEPIVGAHIKLFKPNNTTSTGKNTDDILSDPNLTLDDVDNDFDEIIALGGNVSQYLGVLMPNKKKNQWESHEHLYVSENKISPYIRFLTDDIPNLKPPTIPVQAYGAAGINKYSYFKNKSTNKSFGFLMVNTGTTKTSGHSELLNDFMDVNGDGYPDIIGTQIQLTAPRGGLSKRLINTNFNTNTSIEGEGALVGGSSVGIKGSPPLTGDSKFNVNVGNQSTGSLSGSYFTTTNKVERFNVDLNGDGLTDIVQSNGKVFMNHGATFTEEYSGWNLSAIESETDTGSGGGGVGFSGISNLDISAGLSISQSTSKDKITYMDLNGDGLPDKIVNGTTYYLNLGTRFDKTVSYLPGVQKQKSIEAGINGNLTYCFYFTIPILFIGPKFCFSVGANGGKNISSEEARYMDFDGDGYIDYITSTRNETMTVHYSRIKRTNLLKKVTQSTGATIELDYDVVNPIDKSVIGSTYKMPFKKWALTKVSVYDGFVGDGENYTRYNYEYYNGYKDRKERNFLGFGMTKAHLMDKNGQVYRTNVTEYLLNDMKDTHLYLPGISSDLKQYLYKKGLVKKTFTLDKKKRTVNETNYTYKFYDSSKVVSDINTSNKLSSEVNVYTNKMSVLPLVTFMENKVTNFDEDSNNSLTQTTTQSFKVYDKNANLKQYVDHDRGLTVDMEYQVGPIKTLVVSHRVGSSSNSPFYRLTKAISNDGIKIHEIRKYADASKYYATNYEYNNIGNLTKKIFPMQGGKRFFYEYVYDDFKTHSVNANFRKVFPSYIKDSFGNEVFQFNTSFGLPYKVIDVYGVEIAYDYDPQNRVKLVKGPYDLEWTIKNEYVSNKQAITSHNLGINQQGTRDIFYTSRINDGLGRALQIKKETLVREKNMLCDSISTNQIPKISLAVSGDIIYDEFGRVIERYLTEQEVDCNANTTLRPYLLSYYFSPREQEKKTSLLYDYKDRVTEELVFGTNALTKSKYSFGVDNQGKKNFTQEVILPMGNKTVSYTNEIGQLVSQKQEGINEELWTNYFYDNLGQMNHVVNAMGHVFNYEYNSLGQITQKQIGDNNTILEYDELGNVVRKMETNRPPVEYFYDFNRLLMIDEPTIATKYSYDKGGRLVQMEDLSGSHEFTYGKLGEVIEETKRIVDRHNLEYFFKTKYKYDSWGRILEMIYPDNEKVEYTYNRVGQLIEVKGDQHTYLKDAQYTYFDQPSFIEYGNNVILKQEFDIMEKLRVVQLETPDLATPNQYGIFSRNTYAYDKNNNIVKQANNFSLHDDTHVGGTTTKTYVYDDFNRLKESRGIWDGFSESHEFSLNMEYLADHSIKMKEQKHVIFNKSTNQTDLTSNTYTNVYEYDKPYAPQLTRLQTEDRHGSTFDRTLEYFENGNIRQIITGGNPDTSFNERVFEWDANNNITAIFDDRGAIVNRYKYDGKGERVSKSLEVKSGVVVNGGNNVSGMYGADEILYPSGNIVYTKAIYTKHYYINGKRIASSIGDSGDVGYFGDPRYNMNRVTPHETDVNKRKSNAVGAMNVNSKLTKTANGFQFGNDQVCINQINVLLNVLYNTPETIDCKNAILAILSKYPSNYCAALELVNTLTCVKKTADGKIIDPTTGYVYDRVTGLPYDPNTGEPIDLGTGNGKDYNEEYYLTLDCYNRYVNYISYYRDKEEKPEEYEGLAKYLECFKPNCEICLTMYAVTLDRESYTCVIDFCKLNIPDLPQEPKDPEPPISPDRELDPGVDDTWQDNPPVEVPVVIDPWVENVPVWWYHSDHLGSSSYITDILGKPCQYVDYLPFGEVMTEQSTNNVFDNIYKFNGKELDESTGYYYYGARYYDPGMSIFLSVDPLAEKFVGWNPYHYVHNNPINLVDPTGMSADPPEKGGFSQGDRYTDESGAVWQLNGKIWENKSGGENQWQNETLNEIYIGVNKNDSGISDAITAGQIFGGTAVNLLKEGSDLRANKNFYKIGSIDYRNSIDFTPNNRINVGVHGYAKEAKELTSQMKTISRTMGIASKTLDYAGYIDGGIKISQGEYASGAHSLGNNYLGAQIGSALGWGYGVVYSASYSVFEKNLPKSEWYNRILFGSNSPTYKERQHYWTKSKFEP